MYIYRDGRTTMVSCKTRSWERAERMAQEEREKYDPVKAELKRIQEQEDAKVLTRTSSSLPVGKAVDRWVASLKVEHRGTEQNYSTFQRKIKDWAKHNHITSLSEVTRDRLDLWRGEWSKTAERRDDRMSSTTQIQFQNKLRAFFAWAVGLGLVDRNPATVLGRIKSDAEPTMPLTPAQFEDLLSASDQYTQSPLSIRRGTVDYPKTGQELRTLFILMRFSGLRISDAVMMSRSALKGNVLDLITIKTKAKYKCVMPDIVVDALNALPQRKGVDPAYFFCSGTLGYRRVVNNWTLSIRRFNEHLSFRDEYGKPFAFHSHMLRDTFAVELLLAGVPLETVSKLLTHKNTGVTQAHYNPWVKARQEQLQDVFAEATRRMGYTVSVPA